MKGIRALFVLLLALALTGCSARAQQSPNSADSQQTAYIENKGSDTIVNLALAWAEAYQALHPEVNISVTGGGSGTGIAALMNGTVDIANASRIITPDEINIARQNGVDPVEFVIARDAIAVIINPHNPIDNLTLEQVADIFSGKINNWSEIGGEDRPIVRLSRETNSGTHIYFLETVLRLGEKDNKTLFAQNTLLLPSSEGITAEVRDNPNAIGYDGLGYVTPEVKVVAIRGQQEGSATAQYILPSIASVNDGTYPISRDLYMYTAGTPTGAVLAYMNWIQQSEAQKIVAELGFIPIGNQQP